MKKLITWLYTRFVDELYFPERSEWSFSTEESGSFRISSNTYPFQEKFICGKVTKRVIGKLTSFTVQL